MNERFPTPCPHGNDQSLCLLCRRQANRDQRLQGVFHGVAEMIHREGQSPFTEDPSQKAMNAEQRWTTDAVTRQVQWFIDHHGFEMLCTELHKHHLVFRGPEDRRADTCVVAGFDAWDEEEGRVVEIIPRFALFKRAYVEGEPIPGAMYKQPQVEYCTPSRSSPLTSLGRLLWVRAIGQEVFSQWLLQEIDAVIAMVQHSRTDWGSESAARRYAEEGREEVYRRRLAGFDGRLRHLEYLREALVQGRASLSQDPARGAIRVGL